MDDKYNFFRVLKKVKATISSVIPPPTITAGTVPSHFAAIPDSKSPISAEDPTNIELTADTRPCISFGVSCCISALRITTLTLSDAPCRNKNSSDNV